jgi:hypothetical protein
VATSVRNRVKKRRAALHKAGLRPVQIWVPDTRRPDFKRECQRQARLVAQADLADVELLTLLDQSLADLDGSSANE